MGGSAQRCAAKDLTLLTDRKRNPSHRRRLLNLIPERLSRMPQIILGTSLKTKAPNHQHDSQIKHRLSPLSHTTLSRLLSLPTRRKRITYCPNHNSQSPRPILPPPGFIPTPFALITSSPVVVPLAKVTVGTRTITLTISIDTPSPERKNARRALEPMLPLNQSLGPWERIPDSSRHPLSHAPNLVKMTRQNIQPR